MPPYDCKDAGLELVIQKICPPAQLCYEHFLICQSHSFLWIQLQPLTHLCKHTLLTVCVTDPNAANLQKQVTELQGNKEPGIGRGEGVNVSRSMSNCCTDGNWTKPTI
jgi:hypothetical protein